MIGRCVRLSSQEVVHSDERFPYKDGKLHWGATPMSEPFLLGWEEWLALPELGLCAIKAKIDTGARTSALHAFMIESFGPATKPKVRFGVHPVPGRDDIEVFCIADVVDRREVTSSNGESDLRYVVRTTVAMGGRSWSIEVTLANRESMAYRMLLGRQAIQEDMFVDAAASFRQPKLNYRVYKAPARTPETQRPLKIALLTQRPENPSNRRILRAAEGRGHQTIVIERTRLSLYIAASEPALFLDGRSLFGVDAIIVRSGRVLNAFSLATVRQLEILGAYAINPADALARLAEPLGLRQTLARAGIAVPEVAVSHADLLKADHDDSHVLADTTGVLGDAPVTRFAVVGGRAIAAMERSAATPLDTRPDWRPCLDEGANFEAARTVAQAAAAAASLGLVAVDTVASRQGPIVVGMTTNVPVAQLERTSGAAVADAIVVLIEKEARARNSRVAAVQQ